MRSSGDDLRNALDALRVDLRVASRVYSAMTQIVSWLPLDAELVDAHLTPRATIELLIDILKIHRREEEIVWATMRVISCASRASHRFQSQAGMLALWKSLSQSRRNNPASKRVLLESLDATDALFTDHAHNQQLLATSGSDHQELIDDSLRLLTHEEDEMLVRVLRVLPAITTAAEAADAAKAATVVVQRANASHSGVLAWLTMCHHLIRLLPSETTRAIFFADISYLNMVLRDWIDHSDVVTEWLAIVTHVCALPFARDDRIGSSVTLALLQSGSDVVSLLSSIASQCHAKRTATDTRDQETNAALLLGVLRLVELWSVRSDGLVLLVACPAVDAMVTPTIAQILVQRAEDTTAKQIQLAALLISQRLVPKLPSLRQRLASSPLLQQHARRTNASGSSTALVATASSTSDRDQDVLLARELTATAQLVLPPVASSSTTTRRAERLRPTRSVTDTLKPSTVAIYSKPRR